MMSNAVSDSTSALDQQTVEEIKALTGFNEQEIKAIYAKFLSLDPVHGLVTTLGFLRLPELTMPLNSRVLRALKISNLKYLDFRKFTSALSVFHVKAPLEEKLDFLFRLYDGDRDNLISRDDLNKTLTIISGEADPALIEYAVEKSFEELGDGKQTHITREDFGRGLSGVDIAKLISFALEES